MLEPKRAALWDMTLSPRDIESIGLKRRSITVEHNIVFNQDDVNTCDNNAIIYGEVQSEGEKNKVIQTSQLNARDIEASENKEPSDQPTLANNQNLTQAQSHLILSHSHQLMSFNPNPIQIQIHKKKTSSMAMVKGRDLKRAITKPSMKA